MKSALTNALLVSVSCGLFGCAIVDESYATLGRKSINGADAFVALLKKSGSVEVVPHISVRVLRRADLIVHFDPGGRTDPDYFRAVEAWLEKRPLSRSKGRSKKERGGKAERSDGAKGKGESRDGAKDKPEQAESKADEVVFQVPPGERTLLYVAFDTTASIPFWERFHSLMKGNPRAHAWSEVQLKARRRARERTPGGPVLFGPRVLRHRGGRLANVEGELAVESLRWPLRQVGLAPRSQEGKRLSAEEVLTTTRGDSLVRAMQTPAARLVVVYNAEPLLNYSLVRRPEREFARRLLAWTLPDVSDRSPRIFVVTGSLLPASDAAREDSPFKILTTYPISVILLHLLALLVLFLFSRWPHESTPLDVPRRGSRAFLEHIAALGDRLLRARERVSAVRAVEHYLRRHNRRSALREVGGPSASGAPPESEIQDRPAALLRSAAKFWEQGSISLEKRKDEKA